MQTALQYAAYFIALVYAFAVLCAIGINAYAALSKPSDKWTELCMQAGEFVEGSVKFVVAFAKIFSWGTRAK